MLEQNLSTQPNWFENFAQKRDGQTIMDMLTMVTMKTVRMKMITMTTMMMKDNDSWQLLLSDDGQQQLTMAKGQEKNCTFEPIAPCKG